MEFETLINKITKWTWLVLGIGCLAGVIFAGAWWHLFTATICGVMWLALKAEEPEDENGK